MVALLQKHNVQFLIDVRSKPYSKFKPEFNKEQLDAELSRRQIRYANWTALGGFPESEHVINQGHVDYSKLARMPEFQKHIERLAHAAEQNYRLIILCSEGKPELCHRSKCIGVELDKISVPVEHIDENDNLISQDEVMSRINGDQITMPGIGPIHHSRRRWIKEESNE